MTLEKSVKLDQITITELGIVLYRETTTITEDGKPISESVHRTSLTPGQDIAGQPEKVVAICNLTWTPEVVAAYEAHVEEQRALLEAAAAQ